MRLIAATLFGAVLPFATTVASEYVPLRGYSGSTFFDKWDYLGGADIATRGNVTYMDRATANRRRLTYVDDAGHAIIRVDNTTNIAPATLVNRASIRIATRHTYGVGTLWIIDANHIPYGCSVWPSFWSLGATKNWPRAGEIDIIEGINLSKANQMALHTSPGCVQAENPSQTGTKMKDDCSKDSGCTVRENQPNSFGQGFARAGGGVYAVQMDVHGIFIWFWTRSKVPNIIKNASPTSNMDVAQFGIPAASYPASGCNITQFFGPQKLILITTLCGSWAGDPTAYASTCPGHCVADNTIGPGSPRYDNAYWNITYIRTYLAADHARPSSPASTVVPTPTPSSTAPPSSVTSAGNNRNDAVTKWGGQYFPITATIALAVMYGFIFI